MGPHLSSRAVAAFALIAIAALLGFALNHDLSAMLLVIVAGIAAVLLLAAAPAPDRPAGAPDETEADAGPDPLIDAIVEPVMLVAGTRVTHANIAARQLLGDHIRGEDVRLAIRHPAATERLINARDGDDLLPPVHLVGLGTRDQRWAMRVQALGDGRRLVHLTDSTGSYATERIRVDFVANASHELRTPLASLLGFIETLSDEAGDDPAVRKRFLGVMFDEARRMQRLIDDLMSLSRIEAEKYRAPEEQVDIAALVEEVRAELAATRDPRGGDIRVDIEPAPAVTGDRAQLSQLLHNLAGNAMKYGKAGTPVTITLARADDAMVRLTVADEGDGIGPEHLPRLTERFYRVDSGRSRSVGGTGLGLAIVKHIVERHRGRLDIASQVGHGTTVSILLPAALSSTRNLTATQGR
ncbi:ATP-binding protein [Sphingomonas sp.]|uniref:ATP-binding protein n=1 Tax=Sphingomonas sp. TaxID=28214 RepID=UPI002C2B6C4C|nr:ATP-binding protein [Sphingomonas sp.]HWK35799.1 ATP-binding protein [Sphingomonas sp.]